MCVCLTKLWSNNDVDFINCDHQWILGQSLPWNFHIQFAWGRMTEGGRRERRQREGRDKGRRREGGGKEGGMGRKEEGKEERGRKYFPEQNSVALKIGSELKGRKFAHIRSPISMGRYLLSSITCQNIGYIPYRCKGTLILLLSSEVHTSCLSCHHISLQIHISLLISTQNNFSLPGQAVLHNLCSVMCILTHSTPERSMKIRNTPQ